MLPQLRSLQQKLLGLGPRPTLREDVEPQLMEMMISRRCQMERARKTLRIGEIITFGGLFVDSL